MAAERVGNESGEKPLPCGQPSGWAESVALDRDESGVVTPVPPPYIGTGMLRSRMSSVGLVAALALTLVSSVSRFGSATEDRSNEYGAGWLATCRTARARASDE